MAELEFYTNPMSRARIVRWMLEETGAEYQARVLAYGPEMKGEYLKVNPMGKVPAIVHRAAAETVVVTEAAAICAYLGDAFPEAGLAPDAGSPARGVYYRWLFFGAGPVEAAVTVTASGMGPGDERAQASRGWGSMGAVLDTLQVLTEGMEREGRPYILGDRFSAADVYLGSQIGWGMMFSTLETRPGFAEYWARLAERPAARRAREIDDALLPAGGA